MIKEEKIIERIQKDTGPYLSEQLATLADHPLVGEIRSIGMLGAIELVSNKQSRSRFDNDGTAGSTCRDHALNNGLILRATGDTMLLSPPLVISREEIDDVVRIIRIALDNTAAEMN